MEELLNAVSSFDWLVYLLTFVLVFVETAGVPLPALTFALLAATLAGQGSLSFLAVVVATVLGGTIGGPVGHSLGLNRGRPLLEKMGGKVRLTPDRLDSTQAQFEKRGKTIVLIRYFVPILPWSAGLFAGITRMPRRTLFVYNFASITMWALLELTIVAFFSSQLRSWLESISVASLFWLTTGAVGTFVLIRMFRRRREARDLVPADGSKDATNAAMDTEAGPQLQSPALASIAAEPDSPVALATLPQSAHAAPDLTSAVPPTEPVTSGANDEPA